MVMMIGLGIKVLVLYLDLGSLLGVGEGEG